MQRDDPLRDECVRIVKYLESLVRRKRTGPLAELRRLQRRGDGPPPEAFWALVEYARVDARREEFWEALVPMMVTCPHRRGAHLGRMLRERNVSASRVERWLRLGAEDASAELRKLLRRVDAVDWVDLARLLRLWDDPERGDDAKRQFARSFFLYRPPTTASLPTASLQPRA